MKNLFLLTLLITIIFSDLRAQDDAPVLIPGQYIVMLKESAATPVALEQSLSTDREQAALLSQPKRDANLSKLSQLRRSTGIAEGKVLGEFADAVVGFSASLTPEEVARLSANPDVEGVYQDYYIQLEAQADEVKPEEFSPEGQTIPCAIVNAGGVKKSTSSSWIWILDTGIDTDHPDLNVNASVPFAKSFIPGQSVEDGNGHGTHVAGIAAAKNNSIGTVGVSAGAMVIPIKVLANNGSASFTYLIQGLNHVAVFGTANDVINLSVGAYPVNNCPTSNPALRSAILNLGNSGKWVCMASGNNAAQAAYCSPGCIDGNRVFTVGGITCSKGCFGASNWGGTTVDWVATGANVYSTYKNGGYATLSGTSQATPVVAGIIHARGGAPVTGGTIICGNIHVPNTKYKIAKWQ